MGDTKKMALAKVVKDSMEKLAFMFFVSDAFREPVQFQDAVTAEVSYTGVFSGRLAMVMTEPVLTELAANMLGIDGEDVEQNHLHDALKETVNIICGNWLPIEGGDEAVFHIDAPRILSPSEATAAFTRQSPSILEKMSVDEEPCDIYFFKDESDKLA
ncbi:MAG: chemotaxis protein CheX [Deltaproteobacteria bacterium]|nr:chemotaxis protein CheX [Deltaproteobacteria bacterium]